MIELSERTWLRMPKDESASSHLIEWRRQLNNEPLVSSLDEALLIDTSRSPNFYRDRWSELRPVHNGLYVGRRPQRYGNATWCIFAVESGIVRRFNRNPSGYQQFCDQRRAFHRLCQR